MLITAKAKNIRMSPRKIRLVVDVVRGMETEEALGQLHFMKKLAAKTVAKLINSAVANAEHNFELDKNNLYIKEIKVDEGATLKRWMPKAHGRATTIRKRTAHITLALAEIKASAGAPVRKKKVKSPVKFEKRPKESEGVKIKKEGKGGEIPVSARAEKDKKIIDPRMEGRHGHARIEGGAHKGFTGKMFRRKSG